MLKKFVNIPDVLFHATFKKNIKKILNIGLIPGKKKNWEQLKKGETKECLNGFQKRRKSKLY